MECLGLMLYKPLRPNEWVVAFIIRVVSVHRAVVAPASRSWRTVDWFDTAAGMTRDRARPIQILLIMRDKSR